MMTISAVTMTTSDLQAQRPGGEVSGGATEHSARTRQVETRPSEVLQLVRRENVRRIGRVVEVIVLQQLRDRKQEEPFKVRALLSLQGNKLYSVHTQL